MTEYGKARIMEMLQEPGNALWEAKQQQRPPDMVVKEKPKLRLVQGG